MKYLSFIDHFSQNPSLKINNSDKYYTIFGLIISFITILSIFSTGVYYIFYCFSRSDYQILERMDHNLIPSHKIFENKISITLTNPTASQFEDAERLYSIDAKFWEINPNEKIIYNITDIPLVNCSIYQNGPFENDFEKLSNTWNTAKCLDFSNLKKNLYGKYASLSG